MHHYGTKIQTTKQTLTTSKYSVNFTCSDFSLKAKRDKLALINHQWKDIREKKWKPPLQLL